jgi:hypothetical protein
MTPTSASAQGGKDTRPRFEPQLLTQTMAFCEDEEGILEATSASTSARATVGSCCRRGGADRVRDRWVAARPGAVMSIVRHALSTDGNGNGHAGDRCSRTPDRRRLAAHTARRRPAGGNRETVARRDPRRAGSLRGARAPVPGGAPCTRRCSWTPLGASGSDAQHLIISDRVIVSDLEQVLAGSYIAKARWSPPSVPTVRAAACDRVTQMSEQGSRWPSDWRPRIDV